MFFNDESFELFFLIVDRRTIGMSVITLFFLRAYVSSFNENHRLPFAIPWCRDKIMSIQSKYMAIYALYFHWLRNSQGNQNSNDCFRYSSIVNFGRKNNMVFIIQQNITNKYFVYPSQEKPTIFNFNVTNSTLFVDWKI